MTKTEINYLLKNGFSLQEIMSLESTPAPQAPTQAPAPQTPQAPAQTPQAPAPQTPQAPAQTPQAPAQTPQAPAQTPQVPAPQTPQAPAQTPQAPTNAINSYDELYRALVAKLKPEGDSQNKVTVDDLIKSFY